VGISERRARDKEALRSRILDAASQLFVEEGIPNVSLRKIAEKIEYSPATIYLYFRDKNQLLFSLCTETFSTLKAELEQLQHTSNDPVSGLRAGLKAYIEFGLAHPHHYMLTFGSSHTPDATAAESPEFAETNAIGLATFDCLRQSLRMCREAGCVQFDDLETIAQTIWTFIHGATSLLILYHKDAHFPWVEKERIIETGLDLIIRGISPPPHLAPLSRN